MKPYDEWHLWQRVSGPGGACSDWSHSVGGARLCAPAPALSALPGDPSVLDPVGALRAHRTRLSFSEEFKAFLRPRISCWGAMLCILNVSLTKVTRKRSLLPSRAIKEAWGGLLLFCGGDIDEKLVWRVSMATSCSLWARGRGSGQIMTLVLQESRQKLYWQAAWKPAWRTVPCALKIRVDDQTLVGRMWLASQLGSGKRVFRWAESIRVGPMQADWCS